MIKNLRIVSTNSAIDKKRLHNFIYLLKKELNFSITSLEISFIDGEEMRNINKKYLDHDYYTDILTFNYSPIKSKMDAELIISTDDALRNARKYKVKLIEEIGRLVIHGLLHLLGYDDKIPKEKRKMKQIENELLNRYKFVLLRYR